MLISMINTTLVLQCYLNIYLKITNARLVTVRDKNIAHLYIISKYLFLIRDSGLIADKQGLN